MAMPSPITHKSRWFLLILLALTLFVFSKTLFFEFVWDDTVLLAGQASYENAGLKELLLTPINGYEYLPLRDLTYVIDYSIWGWNPIGFHLSNLVLYILNIWAVYGLTVILTSKFQLAPNNDKSDMSTWTALVAAALFAVLPVHSEVVSFIHCRNVLLSGLFFFLSCIYFLKFSESHFWRHLAISFILFAFALLSKATVIILPLVLLTFIYCLPGQKTRDYFATIPFFLLSVIFYFVFKSQASQSNLINEDVVLAFGSYNFLSKIAVALQIPFFYVAKLLVPVGLSTEYRIGFSRDFNSIEVFSALFAAVILLTVSYYYRKRLPQVLFALAWFLICLVPVLNFFLTNPVVADRYVYLSSFAYVFILATLLQKTGNRVAAYSWSIIFILILGTYSALTFERNEVWRSQLTVLEDMTRSSPTNPKGFIGLGQYYFERNQFPKAFEYLEQAKALSPALSGLEYYKARLALINNQPLEALKLVTTTLKYDPTDALAWNLQGQIYESLMNFTSAARSYQNSLKAVRATSETKAQASTRLEYVRNQLKPMLTEIMEEISNHPEDLDKKAQFAVELQSAGFQLEAISLYEDLLNRGGPNWQIYFNLGLVYSDMNQADKALINYQKSLSLNESYALTHNEMGILYKQLGEFDKAENHFHRAIQLEPSYVKAHINLARLYFQLGKRKSASEILENIIKNFPEYETLAKDYLSRIKL